MWWYQLLASLLYIPPSTGLFADSKIYLGINVPLPVLDGRSETCDYILWTASSQNGWLQIQVQMCALMHACVHVHMQVCPTPRVLILVALCSMLWTPYYWLGILLISQCVGGSKKPRETVDNYTRQILKHVRTSLSQLNPTLNVISSLDCSKYTVIDESLVK